MCTFQSEREVMVCDVAIENVKAQVSAGLGNPVRYTVVDGQGTLVEAGSDVDPHRFEQLVKTGIAETNREFIRAPG